MIAFVTKIKHCMTASLCAATLISCGQVEETTSTPSFQVGNGNFKECKITDLMCLAGIPGHEVLTRVAIVQANAYIAFDRGVPYPEIPEEQEAWDSSGEASKSLLVRGNYTTDKPDVINEFGEALRTYQSEVFNVPKSQDWHGGGDRQKFHSLRDYRQDTSSKEDIDSSVTTCRKVQEVLKKDVELGLQYFKGSSSKKGTYAATVNQKEEGLLFLGSALHTLQDSFSKAHVKRDLADLSGKYNATEFCKFGSKPTPGVCHHEVWSGSVSPHAEDRIYNESLLDGGGFLGRTLKPEARLAARTSAYLLVHVHNIASKGRSLDDEMNAFFKGSSELKQWLTGKETIRENFKTGSLDCELIP